MKLSILNHPKFWLGLLIKIPCYKRLWRYIRPHWIMATLFSNEAGTERFPIFFSLLLLPMGVINATFIFDHKFDHQLVTKLSIEGVLQPQEVASSQNIYLAYVSVWILSCKNKPFCLVVTGTFISGKPICINLVHHDLNLKHLQSFQEIAYYLTVFYWDFFQQICFSFRKKNC